MSPSIETVFSTNVRSVRERLGLSQLEVARRAGIPRSTMASMETDAANPSLELLDAVARGLGVRVGLLLGYEGDVKAHLALVSISKIVGEFGLDKTIETIGEAFDLTTDGKP